MDVGKVKQQLSQQVMTQIVTQKIDVSPPPALRERPLRNLSLPPSAKLKYNDALLTSVALLMMQAMTETCYEKCISAPSSESPSPLPGAPCVRIDPAQLHRRTRRASARQPPPSTLLEAEFANPR